MRDEAGRERALARRRYDDLYEGIAAIRRAADGLRVPSIMLAIEEHVSALARTIEAERDGR